MKRVIGWLWIAVAIAAVHLGWTLLSRQRANDRTTARTDGSFPPPTSGGNTVRIGQFYARSGEIFEGDRNVVCYGVEHAKSLRLEPPVADVYPALVRCFWIEPRRDTTYTLTADGFDGSRDTAAFTVHVKPPPPEFRFVDVSDRQIPRGEVLTVCYGVEHATRVRLDPLGWNLPPSAKNCIRFYPSGTYTYSLQATGAGGSSETERFRVRVQ